MSLVNQSQLSVMQINNQRVPNEGPKVIPVTLDFTAADAIAIDLTQFTQSAKIQMIQTVFLDTSGTDTPLSLVFSGGAPITIKGRMQGYFPATCPNPPKMVFACPGSGVIMTAYLYNIAIAGAVWPTQ